MLLYLIQPVRISPNKGLARTVRIPGVTETEKRTSPWGIIHVLEGPSLRGLPGLSLRYEGEIPRGRMVFQDGDSIGLRISADAVLEGPLDFLSHTIQSIAYVTLTAPDAVVLGAAGGTGMLQALWEGAPEVTLVEQNPVILEQTRDWLESFSGERFPTQEVVYLLTDARRFLQDRRERYDLITLDVLGSAAASFAGAKAFQGDYLLTQEGLGSLFERVHEEDGILAFTFWTDLPPRKTFKLISTLVEVYRSYGVADPSDYLFVARGWSACTTLAFRSPLSAREIASLRSFCDHNDFDLVYCPGMLAGEANRRHRLERPFYHEGISALLGDQAEAFKADYLFFIRPASDRKPYFHRFFKGRTFPRLWRELGRDWILLREWGYAALWLTLLSAFVLGAAFLLPPVILPRSREPSHLSGPHRGGRTRRFLFFGCLGGAFMTYEMVFIEQYVFLLSYPLLSVAVIIAAILVFSSIGSLFAGRCMRRGGGEGPLLKSCFALTACGAVYSIGLMDLFRLVLDYDLWFRGVVAFLTLAPPCLLMGMPFPTGLSWLRVRDSGDVPLCWGINGWASVVFAALTPLLAVHMGLPGALSIGAGLYLTAGCLGTSMVRRQALQPSASVLEI
jgi:hypothetical protein